MKRKEMKFNDNLLVTFEKESSLKGVLIIYMNGRIDAYNANDFFKALKNQTERGYTKFIFDCSDLQYLSSAGIASFTKICDISSKKKGTVFLANMPPKLVELVKLVNFAHLFEYAPDVDIARILIKKRLKKRKKAVKKEITPENNENEKN